MLASHAFSTWMVLTGRTAVFLLLCNHRAISNSTAKPMAMNTNPPATAGGTTVSNRNSLVSINRVVVLGFSANVIDEIGTPMV